MVSSADIGQWVRLIDPPNGPVAVLDALADGKALIHWGTVAIKDAKDPTGVVERRYEAWVAPEDIEVVPGRPAAAVEATRHPEVPAD